MLLKRLSFVSILFLQNILAGDFLDNKSEKNPLESLLQKRELHSNLSSFYEDLSDGLTDYFTKNQRLKRLTARPDIILKISKLLKKLKNYKLVDDEKIIQIFDEDLGGFFEFKLFQLINYLLFISKITDTALATNSLEKNLAIFSDNVFSNQLLIFLLVYYLKLSGYKSITFNLLTKIEWDYRSLESVIQNYGIAFKINPYQSASDLIDSQNKIDIYISDLSLPTEQSYFKCLRKKRSMKQNIFLIIFLLSIQPKHIAHYLSQQK